MGADEFVMRLPRTEKAIRENFPRPSNAGLRKRLREEALSGAISGCNDVALTIWGQVGLDEVHKVHREEMVALGLVNKDGYPKYEIAPNEHGVIVAYLDQPAETYDD